MRMHASEEICLPNYAQDSTPVMLCILF